MVLKQQPSLAHTTKAGIITLLFLNNAYTHQDRSTTVETRQIYILIGLVVLTILMFLPQWQARRRRQKQMAVTQIGDQVMTVGGIIGKLTYLDTEENRARVEIAPGVEITLVIAGISRPIESP